MLSSCGFLLRLTGLIYYLTIVIKLNSKISFLRQRENEREPQLTTTGHHQLVMFLPWSTCVTTLLAPSHLLPATLTSSLPCTIAHRSLPSQGNLLLFYCILFSKFQFKQATFIFVLYSFSFHIEFNTMTFDRKFSTCISISQV